VNRPGLTLLETLIALVILGLVVVSGLELLAGTRRLSAEADAWSRAVVYAEEGVDAVLTTEGPPRALSIDTLAGGFSRRIEVGPWDDARLLRVDVTVTWPGGGRFQLSRLATR
jgi:prepilin-type N-terminal cleavage/methylation domain-containing protein